MRSKTHGFYVKNRWVNKARAEVLNEEGAHAERDTVWTQRSHHQHFLELITVILPVI